MDRDNPPHRLALYEERLVSLWERVVAMLGIHTARVLLQQAIGQVGQIHPALGLIQHDASGFSFEALEKSDATRTPEEAAAAFGDLCAEMLRIATQLVDQGMAQRLVAPPPNIAMWRGRARTTRSDPAEQLRRTHGARPSGTGR